MAAMPGFLLLLLFGAGFGEETFFRGYLFERLRRLLGPTGAAMVATVVITSALFAAAHLPGQGVTGAEQAAITGLVFGAVYALTGGLPFVMIAHAAFDLTAYAIIFFDVETTVAHWVFR
jgi:CAAX protease family protein